MASVIWSVISFLRSAVAAAICCATIPAMSSWLRASEGDREGIDTGPGADGPDTGVDDEEGIGNGPCTWIVSSVEAVGDP